MAGSLTTWEMKGSAARTPTCRLLAPRARAYAAMKPPLPRLNMAPEVSPSQARKRRLRCASSSETVGRGRRNAIMRTVGLSPLCAHWRGPYKELYRRALWVSSIRGTGHHARAIRPYPLTPSIPLPCPHAHPNARPARPEPVEPPSACRLAHPEALEG